MEKKDYIKAWVKNALTKTKNVNQNASSSYGLKHYCEDSIGEYVSNDEMKEVMKELGFISKTENNINELYNISKRINRVIFLKSYGIEKNNSYRLYSPKSKEIILDHNFDIFILNKMSLDALLTNALWVEELNSKIAELKSLIKNKYQLNFSKHEFIKYVFFNDEFCPYKELKDYDDVDEFKLEFYKDCYEAITNKNYNFDLDSRLEEFNEIFTKYNNENFIEN